MCFLFEFNQIIEIILYYSTNIYNVHVFIIRIRINIEVYNYYFSRI